MYSNYVIQIRGEGQPAICLPVQLADANLKDISTISDYWAKFVDVSTGEIHDCALYYKAYCLETQTPQ